MRIISGIYKSRILKSPASGNVRPTSDRAKKTLFDILNNRIRFEGKICFDIFCGSGSLGLECISRGATICYFVDKFTENVIQNIEILNTEEKCRVFQIDAFDFLKKHDKKNVDLIFCDPPYSFRDYDRLLQTISEFKTILILEHSEKFVLNGSFEKFVFLKKKIGMVNFTFFEFS